MLTETIFNQNLFHFVKPIFLCNKELKVILLD